MARCRWLAIALMAGCAGERPPPAILATVVRAANGETATLAWGDRPESRERPCSVHDIELGPVTATASWGSTTYACRLGGSPRAVLEARVRAQLRPCLDATDRAGFLELELQISAHGRVTRVAIADHDDAVALGRCAPDALAVAAPVIGCRWRATVGITAHRREP